MQDVSTNSKQSHFIKYTPVDDKAGFEWRLRLTLYNENLCSDIPFHIKCSTYNLYRLQKNIHSTTINRTFKN